MRIAIPSTGKDLTAEVDIFFDKAAFFFIVDTKTHIIKFIENKFHDLEFHEAGKEAAHILDYNGVDVLITHHCDMKSFRHLWKSGKKVLIGVKGPIADAVVNYLGGKLDEANHENKAEIRYQDSSTEYRHAC